MNLTKSEKVPTIGFFWCPIRLNWYVTYDNAEVESFRTRQELAEYLEILEKSLKS